MKRLAVAELRRGVSVRRIASELGMSRGSVTNWGRAAGVSVSDVNRVEPLGDEDEEPDFEYAS